MNPIENVWDEMEQMLKNHRIRGKYQLSTKVEWGKIELQTTKKLVQTVPKRMREIIRTKGDPTDHSVYGDFFGCAFCLEISFDVLYNVRVVQENKYNVRYIRNSL